MDKRLKRFYSEIEKNDIAKTLVVATDVLTSSHKLVDLSNSKVRDYVLVRIFYKIIYPINNSVNSEIINRLNPSSEFEDIIIKANHFIESLSINNINADAIIELVIRKLYKSKEELILHIVTDLMKTIKDKNIILSKLKNKLNIISANAKKYAYLPRTYELDPSLLSVEEFEKLGIISEEELMKTIQFMMPLLNKKS